MRKSMVSALLIWVTSTFTGPYAMTELMAYLNQLSAVRAKEAKVIQELRPGQGGAIIQYTIIYRADDTQPQEDE